MWTTGDTPTLQTAQEPGRTALRRRLGRADTRAVPEARHALRGLLAHWGGPGRRDTAELLSTELLTNALLHTTGDAVLTVTVTPYRLHVEVRDFMDLADRVPSPRSPRPDDGTSGRGLMLVAALADAWGVSRDRDPGSGGGKTVWFELAADGG